MIRRWAKVPPRRGLAEYLLTDPREFDILLCGHGSLASDAIRSTPSTRVHHLGGVVATWPLAARALQPDRMRRIGVLVNLPADDPQAQVRNAALLQGLQELGWTVGRNVRVDFRWGEDNVDRSRRYAAELVALAPDVILASGGPSLAALQFVAVVDPVGRRFPGPAGRERHRLYDL